MAALYKYEIIVVDMKATKEREDALWDLGRSGWEVYSVMRGDYKSGEPDAPKLSFFVKREATHDINF